MKIRLMNPVSDRQDGIALNISGGESGGLGA